VGGRIAACLQPSKKKKAIMTKMDIPKIWGVRERYGAEAGRIGAAMAGEGKKKAMGYCLGA